ncbi:hypothetical protein [Saprospira grandis]|uniref:Uncharacterized protein n=1 Tax=Saprospira grandis (strain Lewin) TaxID=984262 RepID=H6L4Y8_SAPGL|nr:hypothetical protein [Saprospira grandis]AFC25163.1 hypothetical protein SGRA_2435 [Saprospira grandis str. Lewin]
MALKNFSLEIARIRLFWPFCALQAALPPQATTSPLGRLRRPKGVTDVQQCGEAAMAEGQTA